MIRVIASASSRKNGTVAPVTCQISRPALHARILDSESLRRHDTPRQVRLADLHGKVAVLHAYPLLCPTLSEPSTLTSDPMMKLISVLFPTTLAVAPGHAAAAGDGKPSEDYMPSLITATPLEGRKLAITIVRKTIGAIQTDGDAKSRVRALYAEDPALLIKAAELVNLEFRVIAEANNYWRK